EARQRGFSLADVSRWMSAATASFVGLEGRKGRIAKGFDADLVFFAPDETFQVDKKQVYHRHKETPHEGRTFTGLVKKTYLRGTKVFENGNFSTSASGQFLLRGKVEAPVS
ncbi:MAG TPA: amidohydrolase family protein, partial [Candidatus Obscuribacterales bacterium]